MYYSKKKKMVAFLCGCQILHMELLVFLGYPTNPRSTPTQMVNLRKVEVMNLFCFPSYLILASFYA